MFSSGLACNAYTAPVFRKGERLRATQPVPFDPDRPAVQAAQRDPREFEILYRRYVGQVYSFAIYELGDRHAAEDVTAQIFLQALAALPRFREQAAAASDPAASSFRVWLFQIARNALRNERRRVRRHPVAPLSTALSLPDAADPAVAAVEHDAFERAWRVIQRLPGDRRRALILRFVDEMPTPQIAAVLGRSEGAVRVLIHRGLRSVAEELRRPVRPS